MSIRCSRGGRGSTAGKHSDDHGRGFESHPSVENLITFSGAVDQDLSTV
jgi:hypothetical protein